MRRKISQGLVVMRDHDLWRFGDSFGAFTNKRQPQSSESVARVSARVREATHPARAEAFMVTVARTPNLLKSLEAPSTLGRWRGEFVKTNLVHDLRTKGFQQERHKRVMRRRIWPIRASQKVAQGKK